ncbi:MAG: FtsW/RodA/SpoVE family cell cycle protein [Bacteroidota bacterium]|nr:FtsW/RodA/SpoVE family cell cycle protein [Bacteroidota bacterium]MDP3144111.1 FtsW/RodA/SpoVE family cell cycle protein [Bacteroidota bacterium]MDP3558166.1 FtsW/RodA/SpoVE family cell cycle protein [Bacteroidota bacterium]
MKLFNYLKGDKVIWAIMFLLSLLSILVVYSAVVTLAHKFQQGNTEYYLFKHFVIIALGFGIAFIFHKIKYTIFSKVAQIGFVLSIPLLIYTLLKGVSAGEASRWLEIPGLGLTFQSSDVAKLMLLIYVARILALKTKELQDFKSVLKQLLLPIGLVCVLILPANFSTAALLFFNCLVLMFVGGINIKIILKILAICVLCASLFFSWVWLLPESIPGGRGVTWKSRVESFSSGDTKSNYQSEQAKIAIATGGVIGKGPGNSTQRAFLPQASSDFIYAIIIEEYGLLTGFGILFLYMILLYRGIKILRDNDKPFGAFVAVGLAFNLVFQALVNMAVAVNLFPVTGQPLPLISMGGTSIWFTMIAMGIILSISRSVEDKTEEKLETA